MNSSSSLPSSNTVPSQPQLQQQTQVQAASKARVTALLDINSILLQEVAGLQAAGKAGSVPPPSAAEQSEQQQQKPSSPEYVECMRRLQSNLAYLASIADRAKKSGGVPPSAPTIMTAPPHLPQLNDLYARLNELFSRDSL